MKVTIETFTPEMCRDIIAENPDNFRRQDGERVQMYARDIAAGRWHLNGETVKYNGQKLLDGKHRMLACVVANKPFTTAVAREVSDHGGIDEGLKRTFAQWLEHYGEKNCRNLASVVNNVIGLRANKWGSGNGSFCRSVDELKEEFAEHRDRYRDATAMAMYASCVPVSTLGAVMFVGTTEHFATPKNSEIATYISEKLRDGVELTDGDPAYVLRERMEKQKRKASTSMPRLFIRAYTILAWNALCEGKQTHSLFFRAAGPASQEFPTVLQATL